MKAFVFILTVAGQPIKAFFGKENAAEKYEELVNLYSETCGKEKHHPYDIISIPVEG